MFGVTVTEFIAGRTETECGLSLRKRNHTLHDGLVDSQETGGSWGAEGFLVVILAELEIAAEGGDVEPGIQARAIGEDDRDDVVGSPVLVVKKCLALEFPGLPAGAVNGFKVKVLRPDAFRVIFDGDHDRIILCRSGLPHLPFLVPSSYLAVARFTSRSKKSHLQPS